MNTIKKTFLPVEFWFQITRKMTLIIRKNNPQMANPKLTIINLFLLCRNPTQYNRQ